MRHLVLHQRLTTFKNIFHVSSLVPKYLNNSDIFFISWGCSYGMCHTLVFSVFISKEKQ